MIKKINITENSLGDTVYKHILSKLLKYELAPGDKISEPRIAKELKTVMNLSAGNKNG